MLKEEGDWRDSLCTELRRAGVNQEALDAMKSEMKGFREHVNDSDIVRILDLTKSSMKKPGSEKVSHEHAVAPRPCLTVEQLAKHFASWHIGRGQRVLLCCDGAGAPMLHAVRKLTDRLMWGGTDEPVCHIPNRVSFKEVGDNQVAMLAGAIGEGKSHALLTSNPNGITVILTVTKDYTSAENTDTNKANFVAYARELFDRAIVEPKSKLEAEGFLPWTSALHASARDRLHIVIDEASLKENFVVCLCNWQSDILANLVGPGGPLEELKGTKIAFLCAGRGMNTVMFSSSASSRSYEIVVVRTQLSWHALCQA